MTDTTSKLKYGQELGSGNAPALTCRRESSWPFFVLEVTMYRVVYQNGDNRKQTLFESNMLGLCINEAWGYVRRGIPPAAVDILWRDDTTGLWMSVWGSEFLEMHGTLFDH